MAHVFISYSRKDSRYAHMLVNELARHNINAWIDDHIDYGSKWSTEIENYLGECPVFIILLSNNAKASKWVKRELLHAQKKEKLIFPLLLEGENWFALEDIQAVDVRDGKLPKKEFFTNLQNILKIRKSGLIVFGQPSKTEKSNIIIVQEANDLPKPNLPQRNMDFPYTVISKVLNKISQQDGTWQLGQYEIMCKKLIGYFSITIHIYDNEVRLAGGEPVANKSSFRILGQKSKPVEFVYERNSGKMGSGYKLNVVDSKLFFDAATEMVEFYKKSGLNPNELLVEPTKLSTR